MCVGSLLLLRCRNFCWLAAVCVPRYWRRFSWGFWNTFDTYREDREKKKKGWHSFAETVGNLSSFWPPPPMPPSSSILRWSRTIVWWFAWDIERERETMEGRNNKKRGEIIRKKQNNPCQLLNSIGYSMSLYQKYPGGLLLLCLIDRMRVCVSISCVSCALDIAAAGWKETNNT